METLVFPAYPICKHHVQVVHNLEKFGLAELVVVIVPATDLALNLYPHLLEFPVKMGMQLPLLHLLMQLLHRFLADGRKKVRANESRASNSFESYAECSRGCRN